MWVFLQNILKLNGPIFEILKFSDIADNGTGNQMIRSGDDLNHDVDPRIFKGFFNHCTHNQCWGCWALVE